ncbi:MAG: hypothetical protein GXO62_02975 [Epsilonproteobacteria bacterium]|nr:hypothetical protein [Campylobacterota bacterium]
MFKKFDYDVDKVIGVWQEGACLLDVKRKRLFNSFAPNQKALVCACIPLDKTKLLSVKIEKFLLNEIDDIEEYIRMNALDDEDDYIIRYKLIEKLKDSKSVVIEAIGVKKDVLDEYGDIALKYNHIDFLGVWQFAFEGLYEGGVIERGFDVFINIGNDESFLSFYSDGENVCNKKLNNGIGTIKSKLMGFKIDTVEILKKGVKKQNYTEDEEFVFESVKNALLQICSEIENEFNSVLRDYELGTINKIYINSEILIDGIEECFGEYFKTEAKDMKFGRAYGCEDIDGALFGVMYYSHFAYLSNDMRLNYSLYLREPVFWCRISGIYTLLSILIAVVFGSYILMLLKNEYNYEELIKRLNTRLTYQREKNEKLRLRFVSLNAQAKEIKKKKAAIEETKSLIKQIYSKKLGYSPKSKDLSDLYLRVKKANADILAIKYDGVYTVLISAPTQKDISKALKAIMGLYPARFKKIEKRDDIYYSLIEVESGKVKK